MSERLKSDRDLARVPRSATLSRPHVSEGRWRRGGGTHEVLASGGCIVAST